MHYAETNIVPDALEAEYPQNINFEDLPNRVNNIKDDLLDIINGKPKSWFRNLALSIYYEVGPRKARSPMVLMGRIDHLRSGYYGPKGEMIIAKTLSRLFLETNILTSENSKPQTPVEFLHEVLIPETIVRLISQDKKNLSLKEARKIMRESSDYGLYKYGDD
ncbi:RTC4-like domain-containing protein [Glomus cerebriforme]|uniref:Restriction of telomere capping protein 4 n=1 Tax=Glomus cerebriforme TaxID=658196 RepID=A0A397SJ10_9GLOM|nr:RTC4-like domain-containing protein [Glomus cerebriforme]